MKRWFRHLFEETGLIKIKYPKGEAWYAQWHTRFWHLRHCLLGYSSKCSFEGRTFWQRIKWFLTGYENK